MIIKGQTTNGYNYEIEERVFKSWDFITALTRIQKAKRDGDSGGDFLIDWMEIVDRLLTKKQQKELTEVLAEKLPEEDKAAGVSFEMVFTEITDIISNAKEEAKKEGGSKKAKNS